MSKLLNLFGLRREVVPTHHSQGIHKELDFSISRVYLDRNCQVHKKLREKGIIL